MADHEFWGGMTVLLFLGVFWVPLILIAAGAIMVFDDRTKTVYEKSVWLLTIVVSKGAAALLLVAISSRDKLWRFGAVAVLVLWGFFVWGHQLEMLFVNDSYSDVMITPTDPDDPMTDNYAEPPLP